MADGAKAALMEGFHGDRRSRILHALCPTSTLPMPRSGCTNATRSCLVAFVAEVAAVAEDDDVDAADVRCDVRVFFILLHHAHGNPQRVG